MYKLHTNEGVFMVRNQPTLKQMARYLRAKRAQGMLVSEIIFCWGPVDITHSAEQLICAQERKVNEGRTALQVL